MFTGRNWIIDGALGSLLEDYGENLAKDPLWSARFLSTNPGVIKEVHKSYLEAGAEILITSSYQASIQGFHKHLGVTNDNALELIECSVNLAKEAIEDVGTCQSSRGVRPLIAGSIGPYGACQADGSEYHGQYVTEMSVEELTEWHRPRMTTLVNAGIDVLAIETIPSLKEGLALIRLLKSFPNTKAWITFSCKDDQHTNYGDNFAEAVKQCHISGGDQIVAVGINCTSPEHIASLLEQANKTLPSPAVLPRVIYPNAGDTWIPGKGWEPRSGEWPFISLVQKWASLGASLFGGCCGLGKSDIMKIAEVVTSLPVIHE